MVSQEDGRIEKERALDFVNPFDDSPRLLAFYFEPHALSCCRDAKQPVSLRHDSAQHDGRATT